MFLDRGFNLDAGFVISVKRDLNTVFVAGLQSDLLQPFVPGILFSFTYQTAKVKVCGKWNAE